MSPEVTGVLLALAAGLCTTIGGACVFFVKTLRRLPLAVCMALSAGVMAYVSFVEIFAESRSSIHQGLADYWGTTLEDKDSKAYAYLFATLCFFGGWWLATFIGWIVDYLVHEWKLERDVNIADYPGAKPPVNAEKASSSAEGSTASLENVSSESVESTSKSDTKQKGCFARCFPTMLQYLFIGKPVKSESRLWEIAHADECFERDTRKFLRMGVFTAITLTLRKLWFQNYSVYSSYNLPEGVATFTASLASEKIGASIAVAIGIHNIPEGFAVSVPLLYGTGKKWHAFFFSVLTGLAEPLGALLAWAILGNNSNHLALGIAFGVISGVMTSIALENLLPEAFKYDPCNETTIKCFVLGMLIMAFSLVLFNFE